jgi:acyl carrier protein
MSNSAATVDVIPRVERAFKKTFGKQIAFTAGVDRKTEPRWTSLKHVEFIIALEAEFGIRFDGADATDMTSVAAVCKRVRQRLS